MRPALGGYGRFRRRKKHSMNNLVAWLALSWRLPPWTARPGLAREGGPSGTGHVGSQSLPRESAGGLVVARPGRQTPETRNPSGWRGATPYCLPTVGLIVPVFGLALAPCWRSAGCRARHRARALGASLDQCGPIFRD